MLQKLQVVELVILSQNLLILSMNLAYHSTNHLDQDTVATFPPLPFGISFLSIICASNSKKWFIFTIINLLKLPFLFTSTFFSLLSGVIVFISTKSFPIFPSEPGVLGLCLSMPKVISAKISPSSPNIGKYLPVLF